jgi:acyl-CoA thioesterase I
MQRWCRPGGISIEKLVNPTDPYQLHMSDWATNRVAQALSAAIAGAPLSTT